MTHYIAFLRAVNVGKRVVRMDALAKIFKSADLHDVKTHIQSGNVTFKARTTNVEALRRKIEKQLYASLGYEVKVMLRSVEELANVVKRNPFKQIDPDKNVMLFVSFLASEPTKRPRLPLRSESENLDVIALRDKAAFTVSRRKKNGWFGFPNLFIEKQLGVNATTRNWTTVKRIVASTEQKN
ncbi:MAG TPA: DUF1697 domain-containing protein [Pyrinomonadaceae bacterium]|jgi:uncharacterized protein (DUF1697 family)